MTTHGRSAVPGVVIRSIRPDDATRLRAFHARLSDETIRNRFFGLHRFLPDAEVDRFTSPARGNEVALVATVEEEIVAVARYIRLSGEDAEVALVVQDAYQGHGIGSRLLILLAEIAWDDGIRRFVADTFAANLAMLGVFMHTPGAVTVESTRRDGSVVHLVMGVVPAHNRLALAADPARTPKRSLTCPSPPAGMVARAAGIGGQVALEIAVGGGAPRTNAAGGAIRDRCSGFTLAPVWQPA